MADMREALADTRASYDHVAQVDAAHIAGELAGKPLDWALLSSLVEKIRALGPIADVGCGPGHVARHLRERGTEVLGCDHSPEMVALDAPDAAATPGSEL